MVETSDVAAAIVFVALLLGAAWRVCRSYQRLCREAATREQLARPDDWMSA